MAWDQPPGLLSRCQFLPSLISENVRCSFTHSSWEIICCSSAMCQPAAIPSSAAIPAAEDGGVAQKAKAPASWSLCLEGWDRWWTKKQVSKEHMYSSPCIAMEIRQNLTRHFKDSRDLLILKHPGSLWATFGKTEIQSAVHLHCQRVAY